MVTSAAETAKLISSLHSKRILTSGVAVLAGAQYSLRDASVSIPLFALTNASRCSRAVSFYPCLMRARFYIGRSSHVWA